MRIVLGLFVILGLLAGLAPLPGAWVHHVAERGPARDSDPDEVLRQMEIGRFWHASRALRDALPSAGSRSRSETLLLARAEAGWENWPAVVELLEGRPWLDREADGRGWLLLGRAFEEEGDAAAAVHAYGRFLGGKNARTTESLEEDGDALTARIRRARVLAEMGATGVAVDEHHRVAAAAPWASGWLGLELAAAAAERGEVEAVRQALAATSIPGESDRARRLEADARLVAGDTAGAVEALVALAREGRGSGARNRAWGRVGGLRMAAGDTAAARMAFRHGSASSPVATSVARGLLEAGLERAEDARRAFEALEGSGEPDEALDALEAYLELRPDSASPLPAELRLRRARLLHRADREDEAVELLRELAELDSRELAGPALHLWSDIQRSRGRTGDARALQNRLVDRFPGHPAAVDVVFFRADDLHDAGDLTGAARGYRHIVEVAPAQRRAGLARMRLGQIHLSRGSPAEAARVFEAYLEAFPRGEYWEEAGYWAARSRWALDEEESARAHVEGIRRGNPLSYYAVLGARLLDEPFEPPVGSGAEPPEIAWIAREVSRARRLHDAGLEAGARSRIDDAVRRADDDDRALLRLSLELSGAGFSLEGIRLAWTLRDRGHEWSRWLLRAVYPFPYRELVHRESEEWGLDPFFVAGLIRQESAFAAGSRSGAGAVGLTQVVPATGRSLARSVGPAPFHERVLTHPEVNLHLGGAYLAELERRFEGDIPLILSAYNAGPTRARQWSRRFPEIEEPLRFTERIPFGETREYVKRVRRNMEVYRWLYAAASDAAGGRSRE